MNESQSPLSFAETTSLPSRVPLTPKALRSVRAAADINLSPDGQCAAFVVGEYVPGEQIPHGRIWTVKTTGGDSQLLTEGPYDSCPRWSPDGQHLAFIAIRDEEGNKGKPQLYLIPAQGGEARRVYVTPGVTVGPGWCRWLPDGRHLLYTAWDGLTHQIGILDEVAGTMTSLVTDFVIGEAFRPYLSATPDLALQAHHVPVELVVYPREDHLFLEYDHLCDVDERTVNWFDRHL